MFKSNLLIRGFLVAALLLSAACPARANEVPHDILLAQAGLPAGISTWPVCKKSLTACE